MSNETDQRIHVSKRLDKPLSTQEKGEMLEDFVEYCAYYNVDVKTWKANKRSMKNFIDYLAPSYSDWDGIKNFNELFDSELGKSLYHRLKTITTVRTSSVKGKVEARSKEMDAESESEDDASQVPEKPARAVTRKKAKPSAAKKDQSPHHGPIGDIADKVAISQSKAAAGAAKAADKAPARSKTFVASQKLFVEDAGALWTNTQLLVANKAERATLLKERENLMERMHFVITDPLLVNEQA